MIDVHLPTTDGRRVILPRYTQPEQEHRMLLTLHTFRNARLAFEDHRPSCIKQIPEAVLAGLE